MRAVLVTGTTNRGSQHSKADAICDRFAALPAIAQHGIFLRRGG